MRKINKITENTIIAVAAGCVVDLGEKVVVKGNMDKVTLFLNEKVFSYPKDAFVVKNINDEIGKYFYDKDAYMLDLPTRYEVYDGPKEYGDAKIEMAMQFMDELFQINSDIFEVMEWDKENGEVKIEVAFMVDEYIDISYDLDEEKFIMTDDYGNKEEAYYNVEDEDWYLFQESFKDAFADLVAETAKSRVYGNILGPDRYK